jgi:hypothetical protein
MPIPAIRIRDTVYVVNPVQVRWFELNTELQELTIYYQDGTMETLRHDRIRNVYSDLQLQFTIIEP